MVIDSIEKHKNIVSRYMHLGLLPFLAGPFIPWILPDQLNLVTEVFFAYSLIIFAFLSGVIWASALLRSEHCPARNLHLAIIFSLLPFIAVFLPTMAKIGFMMVSFLVLLYWEKRFMSSIYPDWYQQLRHRITFVVVACHMLVIANLTTV